MAADRSFRPERISNGVADADKLRWQTLRIDINQLALLGIYVNGHALGRMAPTGDLAAMRCKRR